MEISEVRVKLVRSGPDKLQAFCSVTIDREFVVRDLKVIEGVRGYFVAMPSRKLSDRCPRCDGKNHLRARFCNDCGARLPEDRAEKDYIGRAKLHVDIAHPISTVCREMIQKKVLAAFHEEMSMSRRPGYVETTYPLTDYDNAAPSQEAPGGVQEVATEKDTPVQQAEDNFGKGLF
jgi:stage V sporulation protein G